MQHSLVLKQAFIRLDCIACALRKQRIQTPNVEPLLQYTEQSSTLPAFTPRSARRKPSAQTNMPLQTAAYNTDWVFSNTSNVSVAKDKDWFFNYTPFSTTIGHIASDSKIEVIGIGDVRLEVNTPSSDPGVQAYATLVLRDVLHCPTAICNIVAFSINYEVKVHGSAKCVRHEKTGVVYLLDSVKLWKLWLVGQPKGQSSLNQNGLFYINALWAPEERARFKAYKEELKGAGDSAGAQAEASQAQKKGEDDGVEEKSKKYTKGEKKWIKRHYESEFKFLQQHGLSIYKEEEREEGRRIVRAMRKEVNEAEGRGIDESLLNGINGSLANLEHESSRT